MIIKAVIEKKNKKKQEEFVPAPIEDIECPHCGFNIFYQTIPLGGIERNIICGYCRALIYLSVSDGVILRENDACDVYSLAMNAPLVFYGTDGIDLSHGDVIDIPEAEV